MNALPPFTLALDTWVYGAIAAVIGLFALILFALLAKFIKLWMQAVLSHAPVGLMNLVMMWLRKVPPEMIVYNRIARRRRPDSTSRPTLLESPLPRRRSASIPTSSGRHDRRPTSARIELPWNIGRPASTSPAVTCSKRSRPR
jgi:hypothetical protein